MSSERSAELALRLWEAFRSRNWDAVSALVDPAAEIETTLAPGRVTTGAEAVELWRVTVETGVWAPRPIVVDELSDEVALVTGPLSVTPAPDGQHDIVTFRFRNGRLVDMRYHATVEDARTAAA